MCSLLRKNRWLKLLFCPRRIPLSLLVEISGFRIKAAVRVCNWVLFWNNDGLVKSPLYVVVVSETAISRTACTAESPFQILRLIYRASGSLRLPEVGVYTPYCWGAYLQSPSRQLRWLFTRVSIFQYARQCSGFYDRRVNPLKISKEFTFVYRGS